MKCLNCENEFEEKRKDTAKFCSAKCRVKYNRKYPKSGITKVQMGVLYNSLLEVMGRINDGLPKDYVQVKSIGVMKNDGSVEPLTFSKPKIAIKRTPAHWVELRRECENADDYAKWLENLENDTFLTVREKKEIKATV